MPRKSITTRYSFFIVNDYTHKKEQACTCSFL
jgi:hypothetical protein